MTEDRFDGRVPRDPYPGPFPDTLLRGGPRGPSRVRGVVPLEVLPRLLGSLSGVTTSLLDFSYLISDTTCKRDLYE